MEIFEYLRRETYPVHVMPLSQAEWRETYPVCKSCRIITFLGETEGIVETWSKAIALNLKAIANMKGCRHSIDVPCVYNNFLSGAEF